MTGGPDPDPNQKQQRAKADKSVAVACRELLHWAQHSSQLQEGGRRLSTISG